MSKTRFTDEDVSRILSGHCAGYLGAPNFWVENIDNSGCINQLALNTPNPLLAANAFAKAADAYDKSRRVSKYRFPYGKSPDSLLRWLEKNGLI